MDKSMNKYFMMCEGTPRLRDKGDYPCSVHFSKYRLNKAFEQVNLSKVSVEETVKIINTFLSEIGMTEIEQAIIQGVKNINYRSIKKYYNLKSIKDIIWLKFTKDGYCGVVAVSNDVNFNIPPSAVAYNEKSNGRWKYNTSGILVPQVNKEWDDSFVLIFPLVDIPEGYTRHDIERAVGNYLIDNNVPIIDFYSHNYPYGYKKLHCKSAE